MAPLVSIALVTRDGAATLPAVLDAISSQTADFGFEVVAVDSGSTDGSVAILERSVDRLITIPPESFNHGLTRNLAVQEARGEFVVLLVQDAVPAGESWLMELTAPLRNDSSIAGSFARQVPRADATVIARHYLEGLLATGEQSVVLEPLTAGELAALAPIERMRRCTFDNVCSCIRRSVWSRIPFREVPIAEDLFWAKEVLLTGGRLTLASKAVVLHSHDRSTAYEFDRTRKLHRQLSDLFELRTIPTLGALGRSILSSLALHWRLERRARAGRGPAAGTWRAGTLAVAWPLGQYLGGCDGAAMASNDRC